MSDELPIRICLMTDADAAFIIDAWVNTIRYSCPMYCWIPRTTCVQLYRQMISNLCSARPDLFMVASMDDDRSQLFGWVCGDEKVTHFCYVKEPFRRQGIANMLIGKRWIFSHWTKVCEHVNKIRAFKPSTFKELLDGIGNQTQASDIAYSDQLRWAQPKPD